MLLSPGSVGGNLLLHKMSFLSYSYKVSYQKTLWEKMPDIVYSMRVYRCVCVDRVFRAVVSHRRLHVNFRTWNHVKNKCPNIFRATVNGRDLMDWTKHSGSDLQAGRPQAGAHVSTKECGNMKPSYQRTPLKRTMADSNLCYALFPRAHAQLALHFLLEYRGIKS